MSPRFLSALMILIFVLGMVAIAEFATSLPDEFTSNWPAPNAGRPHDVEISFHSALVAIGRQDDHA